MGYQSGTWLGMAAMAAVLLCAGATRSEPARSGAGCSACNQRVAALEARVGRLEKSVAFLQTQLRGGKSGASTSKKPAAPPTVPGSHNVGSFPPMGGCSPPYTFDAKGIQRPKRGCENTQSSPCDPPYVIDAEGLRRPKPECLH